MPQGKVVPSESDATAITFKSLIPSETALKIAYSFSTTGRPKADVLYITTAIYFIATQ